MKFCKEYIKLQVLKGSKHSDWDRGWLGQFEGPLISYHEAS